ncbi:tetratricopeptide repeat-containing sensor histidine kinase [Flavivirga algicola]|uniref:Oxygen sensor histidine kinase NreB n=1 Tax=Flavivirga algicola TaxID=2729136 RepID=A0ABX1RVJ4_9FLAO|nr:sensor histidine kinase [Flavivirga algicola]NMH86514.1 sensor histidine kinase [Flavivirga algicola]
MKTYYLNINHFIQVCIFIHTCFCFSQKINLKHVYSALEERRADEAILILSKIDTLKTTTYDKALIKYYLGEANLIVDNHGLAYKYMSASKLLFKQVDSVKDVADCNIALLRILSHQNNVNIETKSIIGELKNYALENNDYKSLRSIYHKIASNYLDENKGLLANNYFNKYIELSKQNNDTLYVAYGLMNKGTVFNDYIKNSDSAIFYFKKSLPTFFKYKDIETIAYNYNNQGKAYYNLNDCKKALIYYLKADSTPIKNNIAKSKAVFYKNISNAYSKCNDYENAYIYSNKLNSLKDSINDTQQNIEISKIKEQYDNEKLRANNLEIEGKRKQNFNLLIGALAFIFFGGITTFLIHKSTKRKQKLAEQEKDLETQKLATVLKEQELLSIDAMIEGQEKERQRIANDLHDDLGGLMATVKLHFNALKDKHTPELFDKTTDLLDETYQKIRSIAHAKNSGVIAKQGLLKAIQNMADKVSSSNKINIEVIDHGLEDRLENSLELTIFRMVQELVTNIIKHAEATEAIIHLTNHDESLNIMVEDNGKGFNQSQITTKNKGMGIHSIDKRIEHLNGTMTIESEIDNGTTIIIDIPI